MHEPRPTSNAAGSTLAVSQDLEYLLTAFRVFQMQHARVLHHESVERGLNITDTRLIFFLAAADGEDITSKRAGEYLELSTGAMTSLIDRLAERNHIERQPHPSDRRSSLLVLTPTGEAVAREIGALYAMAFTDVVEDQYQRPLAVAFEQLSGVLAQLLESSR
jgi:DNA-binding MarR family transcriptional regulator